MSSSTKNSKTQNQELSAPIASKTQVGRNYESRAAEYLMGQGYELLATNFTVHRVGEIDLIMERGLELVFVEVKRRASSQFGGAAVSITPAKQRKLRSAAAAYLAQHGHLSQHFCRFDAVLFDGDQNPQWIKGAF